MKEAMMATTLVKAEKGILFIETKNVFLYSKLKDSLTFTKKSFQIDPKTGSSVIKPIIIKSYIELPMSENILSLATYIGNKEKILNYLKTRNIPFKLIEDKVDIVIDWSIFEKYKGKFREGQEECLRLLIEKDRGIVAAPTGWGKTQLFYFISKLFPYEKIDIIAPRLDSLAGIVNRLKKHLDEDIGVVKGNSVSEKRITVCSIGSLHKVSFNAGIVLADEVQNYGTDRRLVLFSRYRNAKKIFGFSADPKVRLDNMFPAIESIFGPIIFDMSYKEAVKTKSVVPIIIKWITIDKCSNPAIESGQFVKKKRQALWANDYRNRVIASLVNGLPEDEQVLILVETVEHLARLFQLLPDFIPCFSSMNESKLRRRGIPSEVINKIKEKIKSAGGRKELETKFKEGLIKKVIATKVWSESVDFPALSILIRADGSASPNLDVQVPGRVSRISEDKTHGIVYDFIDKFSKQFYYRSYKRMKNYQSKGWKQEGLEDFNFLRKQRYV